MVGGSASVFHSLFTTTVELWATNAPAFDPICSFWKSSLNGP